MQLTPVTVAAWMGRLDEKGPEALIQTTEPVNTFLCLLKSTAIHPDKTTLEIFELEGFETGSQNELFTVLSIVAPARNTH
jgi:hypothetical protein